MGNKQEMIKLKSKIKKVRLILSGKFTRFYKDDTFIVSYPKSGNTWMRFILSNLLYSNEADVNFHTAKDFIPDFEVHKNEVSKLSRPRMMKSHAVYNSNFSNVIYLVRDVRDVYISYYHYVLKTLPNGTSLSKFIRDADNATDNWSNHFNSWKTNKKSRILYIKYEDLLENPQNEIQRVVDFLEIACTEEEIAQAIEKSSFENMSNIEDEKGRPFLNDKHKANATKFIRSGKKGEWRNVLSNDDIEFLNTRHKDLLTFLGYSI